MRDKHVYDSFMDKTFIKHTVDIYVPVQIHHYYILTTATVTNHYLYATLCSIDSFSALLICLSSQLRLVIRGVSVQSTETVRTSLETGHVTESVWSPSVSGTASTALRTRATASKTLLLLFSSPQNHKISSI